jgi:hypothetical protein
MEGHGGKVLKHRRRLPVRRLDGLHVLLGRLGLLGRTLGESIRRVIGKPM